VRKTDAEIVESASDKLAGALDCRYLGYFQCFNQQLYFEAHEALEPLWLAERAEPNGHFYQGLIQLAGAFVHLRKHRVQPAVRLLQRAETNLAQYPSKHQGLELPRVRALISQWLDRLSVEKNNAARFTEQDFPVLSPPTT
jgi:predicted metal-dependent hydrolase